MLKVGDVLDLGVAGQKFCIKKTATETSGEALEMEWEYGPQTGGPPIHIHPHATESYSHTYRNASHETTRVYNSHQPALKFEEYFEGLHTLAKSGVFKSNQMTFEAILYLSALMIQHKDETRLVSPPYVIMQVFGFIGG